MSNTKLMLFSLFVICLTTFMLWLGWSMATTTINLNESLVTNKKLIKINFVKSSKNIIPRTSIILESENNGFSIYRASQDYQDITNKLTIGNKIKIYHSKYDNTLKSYIVYQLEQNGQIIYPKQEYEKQEQFAGKYIVLPAAILMIIFLARAIIKRFLRQKNSSI